MRTVQEIIDLCGGAAAVESHFGRKPGWVRKLRSLGYIPEARQPGFIRLSGNALSIEDFPAAPSALPQTGEAA